MGRPKITVLERSELGTANAKRLRREGNIPGIVYGRGKRPLPVKITAEEFHNIKSGAMSENVLLDLIIEKANSKVKKTVIVKDVQKDIIKGNLLHIDFNEISLQEKLKASVSLEIIGEAKGVIEGGVLEQIMYEVDIECLPADLPERISVDVSNLEIGQTIYTNNLQIPDKVSLLADAKLPVVSVSVPKAEEEAVTAPVEGEEGEAEPEVITKGKKEEEGEETAEGEPKSEGKLKGKEEKKEKK